MTRPPIVSIPQVAVSINRDVLRRDLLSNIDPEDTGARALLESMIDNMKMSLTLTEDGTGSASMMAGAAMGSVSFDGTWVRDGDRIRLQDNDDPNRVVQIIVHDGWLEVERQLKVEDKEPMRFEKVSS